MVIMSNLQARVTDTTVHQNMRTTSTFQYGRPGRRGGGRPYNPWFYSKREKFQLKAGSRDHSYWVQRGLRKNIQIDMR